MQGQSLERCWGWCFVVWMLLWGVAFYDALSSAATVWWVNDTFNHCFLVLPAVLYAVWQQRGAILEQPPCYSWLGLAGLLVITFVYALGTAASAELLQHLAIFSLIPATVLWLFGWRVIRQIWAPLAFVLFSVPVGEELMPYFQDLTAQMAVFMLRGLDIPVYREGLYLVIPNGSFVVAEACSGVRFFVACVVLGCAYAYLNFIAPWRSIVFVLFSIIMPIIANGIRAFGIIYIGYSTNMEHAVGADHLVYGWFFFAVIVMILIAVGHVFSDGQRQWASSVGVLAPGWQQRPGKVFVLAAALPLVLGVLVQLLVSFPAGKPYDLDANGLAVVTEEQANAQRWTPRYRDATHYRLGYSSLYGANLYQAIYSKNDQDSEMVSSFQRLFDIEQWSLKDQYVEAVPGFGSISVYHVASVRGEQRLLAFWYVLPGRVDSRGSVIKLQQAINTLLLRPSGGALVAVSISFRNNPGEARQQLSQALHENASLLSRPIVGE